MNDNQKSVVEECIKCYQHDTCDYSPLKAMNFRKIGFADVWALGTCSDCAHCTADPIAGTLTCDILGTFEYLLYVCNKFERKVKT